MAIITIKADRGLKLSAMRIDDEGMVAVDNAALDLDGVWERRTGTVEPDMDGPAGIIPLADRKAIWYRDTELSMEAGYRLYTQTKCTSPLVPVPSWQDRGPWTRGRLRVRTVRQYGERIASTDVAQLGYAGCADCCLVAVTEVAIGPQIGVWLDIRRDSLERHEQIDSTGAAPRIARIDEDRAVITWVRADKALMAAHWRMSGSVVSSATAITIALTDTWHDLIAFEWKGVEYAAWAAVINATTVRVQVVVLSPGTWTDVDSWDITTDMTAVRDVALSVAPDEETTIKLNVAIVGDNGVTGRAYASRWDLDVAFPPVTATLGWSQLWNLAEDGYAVNVYSFDADTLRVWTEVVSPASQHDIYFYDVAAPPGLVVEMAVRMQSAFILSTQAQVGSGPAAWFTAGGAEAPLGQRSGAWLYDPETTEVVGRAGVARIEASSRRGARQVKSTLGVVGGRIATAAPYIASDAPSIATALVWETGADGHAPANIGHSAVAAHGGYPRMFDGEDTCEHDWHHAPYFRSIVIQPPPAGPLAAGTYVAAQTYAWTDAQGRFYRSQPSFFRFTINQPLSNVAVTTKPYQPTERDGVVIELWRSLPNQAVLRLDNTLESDPKLDTQVMSFVLLDAVLAEREQLTQGAGELFHTAVAATDFCFTAAGRLLTADPEDTSVVHHSFPEQTGQGVAWNFAQVIGANVGECVGGGDIDSRLIFIGTAGVSYTDGAGPDAGGVGAFASPSRLPVVRGGVRQEAIVETPLGLAYVSERGPYLITRGMGLVPIGAPVAYPWEAQGRQVGSAVYEARPGLLHIADSAAAPGTGHLILHFESSRWGRNDGWNARDLATDRDQGQLGILGEDGHLLLSTLAYADRGQPYTFGVTTPWIRTGAGQTPGFTVGRIHLVGTYLGAHELRVEAYFDFETTPRYTAIKTAAELAANEAAGKPYVYEWIPEAPCMAFQLRISDNAPGNPSFRLESITITLSPHQSGALAELPQELVL